MWWVLHCIQCATDFLDFEARHNTTFQRHNQLGTQTLDSTLAITSSSKSIFVISKEYLCYFHTVLEGETVKRLQQ